jgi:hypothetical protein
MWCGLRWTPAHAGVELQERNPSFPKPRSLKWAISICHGFRRRNYFITLDGKHACHLLRERLDPQGCKQTCPLFQEKKTISLLEETLPKGSQCPAHKKHRSVRNIWRIISQ